MKEFKKALIETRNFLQEMLNDSEKGITKPSITAMDLKHRIKNINRVINSIEHIEKMVKKIRIR